MQTVSDIIKSVYGDKDAAAARLGVGRSAIWNWESWGYFPDRLAVPIFEEARSKDLPLDISEIPTREKARARA